MVRYSKCALVATRRDGETILPADVSVEMRTDFSNYQPFGDGSRWQSAGFTIFENSHESFRQIDEPSEAFFASQRQALARFATLLEAVDSERLSAFCGKGVKVEVVIGMVIDDDQMELDLPSEFMAQLGRLKIPLLISTDGI